MAFCLDLKTVEAEPAKCTSDFRDLAQFGLEAGLRTFLLVFSASLTSASILTPRFD